MTELTSFEQLDNAENLEKYKAAGTIASKALNKVIKHTNPGISILKLCKMGDDFIASEVHTVYKNNKLKNGKGIAFPTCVSRNNYVGFYSPLDDTEKIENGDIVNIELGVHIDGFPAIIGYTVVVKHGDVVFTEKQQNVVKAVAEASKTILPLFKEGKKNTSIVKHIQECADKYNCNLLHVADPHQIVPGIISYQVSQNILYDENNDDEDDIHNIILHKVCDHYDFTMAEVELIENEVYVVDVVMSTGDGKINQTEDKTTIYKKKYKNRYNLKTSFNRNFKSIN